MLKRFIILISIFTLSSKLAFDISKSTLEKQSSQESSSVSQKAVIYQNLANYDDPFVFSALPSFDQNIQTSIKTADARPEIIRQYLKKYDSPLEPYSDLIVALSDQYNFDYRWLVAIAQQESSLCKRIPENSYNCWGWGIYGDKVTRFQSFDDALVRIAPQFTKIFLKGDHSRDPMEVMKTYTPPSDGSWADGVSYFFDKLQ